MAGVNIDMCKLVIKGHMMTSQTWSVGMWLACGVTTGATAADLDGALAGMDTMLNTWWTAIKAFNAPTVQYDASALYLVPAGSNAASLTSLRAHTAVVGTGAAYTSPRQALVVSILSGHSGKSFRGRSYVPYTGQGASTNMQAANGTCDAYANAHAALLDSLRAYSVSALGGTLPVYIRSEAKGIATPTVQVRCDSLIDTQRRREDKIGAAYAKLVTL